VNIKFITAFAALFLIIAYPSNAGILDVFRTKSIEDQIKEPLVGAMNKNKQAIFNGFHPTGTATKVEVHAVEIAWKNNKPSNDIKNVLRYGVRYTIYWKGPVNQDGFTKIYSVFDQESLRWVGSKVLETNGITNADAADVGIEILRGLLNSK
jgi:hypothetical protein